MIVHVVNRKEALSYRQLMARPEDFHVVWFLTGKVPDGFIQPIIHAQLG
jgi:hypothetical protein